MVNRWPTSGTTSTILVLAPEGLPASRRSHLSSCVLYLKKNQNAPRPSDVILCLDCCRIALIGRCLVKKMFLIGLYLLNLTGLFSVTSFEVGIIYRGIQTPR